MSNDPIGSGRLRVRHPALARELPSTSPTPRHRNPGDDRYLPSRLASARPELRGAEGEERDADAEERPADDVCEPVNLEVGAAPGHAGDAECRDRPPEPATWAERGEEEH